MAHIPVNHPMAGFYRVAAGAAGGYVLIFGILGAIRTWGAPFFSRDDTIVLGLRSNLAFALLSVVVGAVVVGGAIVGGMTAHWINLVGGAVFLLAGMVMLAFLQTSANLLNFSVTTCIVSFLIGLALLLAGLYDKVGSEESVAAEERFRVTGQRGESSGSASPPGGSARSRPG